LVKGLNSLFTRVDDMTLESFDGLEMIPGEILQQGTKKIAASIRGLLAHCPEAQGKQTRHVVQVIMFLLLPLRIL